MNNCFELLFHTDGGTTTVNISGQGEQFFLRNHCNGLDPCRFGGFFYTFFGGVTVAYQAIYRRWRPLVFDDVVGQNHITTTLKNQVMLRSILVMLTMVLPLSILN